MKAVLIDDHALFRQGLEGLLKRRGVDTKACSNAKDGIQTTLEFQPDVVLVDLKMPEIGGIQALKLLREKTPKTPVLILTTSDDANDLKDCLKLDASGYLLKDMNPDELVVALKKVIDGEMVVAPELAVTLASIIQNNGQNNTSTRNQGESTSGQAQTSHTIFESLSPREMEILEHLTEGQSNKVIAKHLGISDGTVKLHVKSILRKLGLHSRVEAAVLAANEGLFRK